VTEPSTRVTPPPARYLKNKWTLTHFFYRAEFHSVQYVDSHICDVSLNAAGHRQPKRKNMVDEEVSIDFYDQETFVWWPH